jgi:hypothetical protein
MQLHTSKKAWTRFSETNIDGIAVLPSTTTVCIRVIGTILPGAALCSLRMGPRTSGKARSGIRLSRRDTGEAVAPTRAADSVKGEIGVRF